MTEIDRTTPPEAARLAIGVIVGAHGVAGQVRMLIWTHFPERIPEIKQVFLDDDPEPRRLKSARVQGNIAVLTIEGVASRDAAEALRGKIVRVGPGDAAPLGEDEYYQYQLIGLEVFDEAGNRLGELVDILETGANDVYVVRDERGAETLLPALKDVILEIDLERGRIIARPLQYYEE